MRTTTWRGLLAALLTLLLTLAAACGDDDGDGGDGDASEVAEETGGDDDSDPDGSTGDDAGDEGDAGGGEVGAPGGGTTADLEQFCRQVEAARDSFDGDATGSDGIQRLLATVASVRPTEQIRADWDTVIDSLRQMAEASERAESDDVAEVAAADEQLQAAQAAFTEAQPRVDAYLRDECGIDT